MPVGRCRRPGVSAIKALEEGSAQVIQSAPSQGFTSLGKGETPIAVHFAQINEMDGFFLTARDPDPEFNWKSLEGGGSRGVSAADSRWPCSSTPATKRGSISIS